MKRFVTYLYEYDRGNRGRNVGFVRTDIRDSFCRMELHIRGLDRLKGKYPVYFAVSEGSSIGVPIGEILISQGLGNLILTFPDQKIGQSEYIIDQLQALVIRLDSGKLLAGCFVREPAEGILAGNFHVWTPSPAPEPEPQTTPTAEGSSTTAKDLSQELPLPADTGASSVSSNPRTSEDLSVSSDPRTRVSSSGIHSSRSSNTSLGNTVPQDGAELSKNLPTGENAGSPEPDSLKDHELASESLDSESNRQETEIPQPEVSYRRIELTDIKSLPQRNWFLSNNRFVVHGFFNYHYLILKTMQFPEGRKRFIGVPGIYEQPERMMALLFGFPEFELSEEARRSRPQEDADVNGSFGYWMCPVAEE